jgi:hypothetical protein
MAYLKKRGEEPTEDLNLLLHQKITAKQLKVSLQPSLLWPQNTIRRS